MQDRRGERIGWTVGWTGGFAWVFILSVVFVFQGKPEQGVSGMALSGVAAAMIAFFAPWRFPATPYWKLMLAPYGLVMASIAWAIWSFGGLESSGLSGWNLLWCLPLLIPFGSLGRGKWADSTARQDAPEGAAGPRR